MAVQPTTQLVMQLADGDKNAASRLMPLIYDDVRRLAGKYLEHERHDHTLQPTALANEVFLRLVNADHVTWQGRAQFLALAACQIRKILVDHARRRNAAKRGGNAAQRVSLETLAETSGDSAVDFVVLDDALNELAKRSPRQARIVELRFFAGMSVDEVADVLEVSPGTVKGDWRTAKAWLAQEIAD